MRIDPEIRIKILDGVYPPSDDSYLLIEAVEIENHRDALDMGCGTGIVSLHLAKNGLLVTSADIDERAVRNTIINARLNSLKMNVVRSDLFENIDNHFDLITFNPPYLPTKNEDHTWDGGAGGIEVIGKFFDDAWRYLGENGEIYIVVSSLTDMREILDVYESRYNFEIIKEKPLFFERLYVYRCTLV